MKKAEDLSVQALIAEEDSELYEQMLRQEAQAEAITSMAALRRRLAATLLEEAHEAEAEASAAALQAGTIEQAACRSEEETIELENRGQVRFFKGCIACL